MHVYADGAAIIPHPVDGGWYYASNSGGMGGTGGIGTLRFDKEGRVIGCKRELKLSRTTRNCGGGMFKLLCLICIFGIFIH